MKISSPKIPPPILPHPRQRRGYRCVLTTAIPIALVTICAVAYLSYPSSLDPTRVRDIADDCFVNQWDYLPKAGPHWSPAKIQACLEEQTASKTLSRLLKEGAYSEAIALAQSKPSVIRFHHIKETILEGSHDQAIELAQLSEISDRGLHAVVIDLVENRKIEKAAQVARSMPDIERGERKANALRVVVKAFMKVNCFEEAIKHATQIPNPHLRDSLTKEVKAAAKNYETYFQNLAVRKSSNKAEVSFSLVYQHVKKGELDKAEEEALLIPDERWKTSALSVVTQAHIERGNLDKAFSLAMANSDRSVRSRLFADMADEEIKAGNFETAFSSFGLMDPMDLKRIVSRITRTLSSRGEWQRAFEFVHSTPGFKRCTLYVDPTKRDTWNYIRDEMLSVLAEELLEAKRFDQAIAVVDSIAVRYLYLRNWLAISAQTEDIERLSALTPDVREVIRVIETYPSLRSQLEALWLATSISEPENTFTRVVSLPDIAMDQAMAIEQTMILNARIRAWSSRGEWETAIKIAHSIPGSKRCTLYVDPTKRSTLSYIRDEMLSALAKDLLKVKRFDQAIAVVDSIGVRSLQLENLLAIFAKAEDAENLTALIPRVRDMIRVIVKSFDSSSTNDWARQFWLTARLPQPAKLEELRLANSISESEKSKATDALRLAILIPEPEKSKAIAADIFFPEIGKHLS